jgi:hypothetical protein
MRRHYSEQLKREAAQRKQAAAEAAKRQQALKALVHRQREVRAALSVATVALRLSVCVLRAQAHACGRCGL